MGFELTTSPLRRDCSTTELNRQKCKVCNLESALLHPAERGFAGLSFFDLNLLHGVAIRSFSEEWSGVRESNPDFTQSSALVVKSRILDPAKRDRDSCPIPRQHFLYYLLNKRKTGFEPATFSLGRRRSAN